MVLKELILNSFYFGRVSGGLERTDFEQFLFWGGVVVMRRTAFEQFLLWEGVVVLK